MPAWWRALEITSVARTEVAVANERDDGKRCRREAAVAQPAECCERTTRQARR